ncbi:MAG TPA: serine hydrolase [Chitinophaga sp.]
MHSGKGPATDPWFRDFLHTTRPLNALLQPLNTGSIQVIYTRVDRDARNVPHFHDFYYQVDPDRYFYPASAVKLPMAAAALEKINTLALPGLHAGTPYRTAVTPPLDRGYQAGRAYSVAEDIANMLTLSSNTAFNRLYQFTGPTLRHLLATRGYPQVDIRHQLGFPFTGAGHPAAACEFMAGEQVIYRQEGAVPAHSFPPAPGHTAAAGNAPAGIPGAQQPGFTDFSQRNRLPLPDLHRLLRSIIFPASVTFDQRFRLTDADHALLLRGLGQWPRQMQAGLPDAYAKFLLPDGDPATLRSFNKAGWAFGFLTDSAYIVDLARGVEFCLSAAIAVYGHGTRTPDDPGHDTIGKPVLKALGQALYAYELERPRKYYPDLQRYAFV